MNIMENNYITSALLNPMPQKAMSSANPLWGAPHIHGELLKLGIDVSQATVSIDFFTVPTIPSALCLPGAL